MGKSDRDQAAQQLDRDLQSYANEARGLNVSANNPFKDYKTPFGYDAMSSQLDKLRDLSMGSINRDANNQIANTQRDVASRLASQGITKGSFANAASADATNSINRSRFNSLADILNRRVQAGLGAMESENQNSFRNATALGNFDQQNIANLLSKYGLIGNAYGQRAINLQNLSGDTWFDDLLAAGTTGLMGYAAFK